MQTDVPHTSLFAEGNQEMDVLFPEGWERQKDKAPDSFEIPSPMLFCALVEIQLQL